MALPVMTYTDPLLTQPNPFITGMEHGMSMATQLQLMRERAQMAPLQRAQMEAKTHGLTQSQQLAAEMAPFKEHLMGAQTKFMPVKTALAAQAQESTLGRFGPSYQFAKLLTSIPADQRKVYMAQHPAQYKAAMNLIGNQIMAPPSPTSGLVNQLLQKAFPGMSAPSSQTQPPASLPGEAPTQLPQAQPQAQAQAPMPLEAFIHAAQATQGAPATPSGAQIPFRTGLAPTPAAPLGGAPQAPLTGAPATGAGALTPTVGQVSGQPSISTTPPTAWQSLAEPKLKSNLTEQEQMQYSANKALTQGPVNDRAESSVGAENMVLANRPRYAKWINQALPYAGALGRGQAEADQWSNTHPQAVEAYRWYNTTFVPAMSNMVKRIEGMGATDSQRAELKGWLNQIKNIKSNPEQARVGVNRTMGMVHEIAQSNFADAEPVSKGLFNKMVGYQWNFNNYLDMGPPKGQLVQMRTPDGRVWHVPSKNVNLALKRGAVRVK
jgi:hypothetical protein